LARYALTLFPQKYANAPAAGVVLAATAILVLAALNAVGLRVGKRTQNVLTAAKLLGLLAIIVVGLTVRAPGRPALAPELLTGSLSLALIQIMFAYGGWADISFVAAEVRSPERNIFRALMLGTATVAAVYVLANLAFLHALGIGGVVRSQAVAVDVVALRLGSAGSRAISLLVVISCLGAINGMLLTGSRVFYALGTHHPTFAWLGAWNEATGVPLRSLVLQTLVTLGLVIACGGNQGFQRLVVVTAPFYWGFIALVGVALIVLRRRGRTREATYHVPLSPLTPLVFAATSGAMVYAGIRYAISTWAAEAWWAVIVLASGAMVGLIDWRGRQAASHPVVI
jgi:amino acid transporter